MRVNHPDGGLYIVVAVLCPAERCEPIRDVLRSLLIGRQRRLHWRDESASRRTKIADAVAALRLEAVAILGRPMIAQKQERARRICLEALLFELDGRRISQVWLERRTPSLDEQDARLVKASRGRRVISSELRVDMAEPEEEPMLWLADTVAGAVGAAEDGQTRWSHTLEERWRVRRIDLR
jgi:hypothetical protein